MKQFSLLLLLCLVLLSACATTNTPQPKKPAARMCDVTNTPYVMNRKLMLPAAQGNWTTFHGNLNRDGAAPASKGTRPLQLAWSYCTGASVFSSPIVQNGVVYIASTATTLTAIDIQSAKILWQIQADDAFFGTPILQNGILYMASLSGVIYAINTKDGFVRWHTQIDTPGSKVWSSPAIANGLLILGAASTLSENPKRSGQVLAFDLLTGKLRWRAYIEAGGKVGGGVWSSPAIDAASKTVYVGTGDPDDGVEALDSQTGKLRWHWRSVVRDVGDTDVGAGPLLYHDAKAQLRVVVGGKNGNIYTLDATTGQRLWQKRVGEHVFSSPTYANNTLYVVGVVQQHATAYALDPQTGKTRWQHDIPVIVYASPIIAGQKLYLAIGDGFESGDGGVTVLNAANGQQEQYVNLHSTTSSSPAVLSAWVLVGAHDGNLYAFVR